MRSLVKISLLLLLAAVGTALIPNTQAQLTQIYTVTNVWRYNIACQDITGWETKDFDDSSWSFGPGGFTGGETLAGLLPVLNTRSLPAPAAAGGHAHYFRTHFNIASTAGISLLFSNAVDDAAVFYLNGTRIFDLRVPTIPTLCATFGGGGIGAGTEALLWEVTTVTEAQLAGILQAGDNVLAVSVHQVNATSTDMVFANVLMQAIQTPPTINYASSSLTNRSLPQCLGSTTLSVAASGFPTPTYQWFHDSNPILNATNATYSINNATLADAGSYYVAVSNAPTTQGVTNTTPATVVTVVPDIIKPTVRYTFGTTTNITIVFSESVVTNNPDLSGAWGIVDTNDGSQVFLAGQFFPNTTTLILDLDAGTPLNLAHGYALSLDSVVDSCAGLMIDPVTVPVGHPIVLIDFDTDNVWKYDIYNGDRIGTGWQTVGFDDSAWPSGPAGLGHESDLQSTNFVPFGIPGTNGVPIRTHLDYKTNGAVAYFRKHFDLPTSTNGVSLTIRHVFEDGAVVYLNGQEAGRYQVPAGVVITTNTLSTGALGDPTPISGSLPLSNTALVAGDNVIAVLLLQSAATSSDLEMALELTAITPAALTPRPRLAINRNGANLVINWTGAGTLQRSTNISSAANWVTIPGATSGFQTNTTSRSNQFFRVTVP